MGFRAKRKIGERSEPSAVWGRARRGREKKTALGSPIFLSPQTPLGSLVTGYLWPGLIKGWGSGWSGGGGGGSVELKKKRERKRKKTRNPLEFSSDVLSLYTLASPYSTLFSLLDNHFQNTEEN